MRQAMSHGEFGIRHCAQCCKRALYSQDFRERQRRRPELNAKKLSECRSEQQSKYGGNSERHVHEQFEKDSHRADLE